MIEVLNKFIALELWFTMENYGTMEKNYGTMEKKNYAVQLRLHLSLRERKTALWNVMINI